MKRNRKMLSLPTAGAGLAITAAVIAVPLLVLGGQTATASDGELTPFGSCDEFVRSARRTALDTLRGSGAATTALGAPALEDSSGGRTAAAQAGGYSTTNVQVAGVDEPDIVKTDGSRVFAVAKGKVFAIDTSGATPTIAGSVTLPSGVWPRDLLLVGDRLVVLGGSSDQVAPGSPSPLGEPDVDPAASRVALEGTAIVDIDVSDPSTPRVRQTLRVDGSYSTARLVGSTARIVLSSNPLTRIAIAAPDEDTVRTALDATNVDSWVPHFTLSDAEGAVTAKGQAVQCTSISRPSSPGQLGMLNLLTLDLNQGITPVDSDAVMGHAETVMASPTGVYVAMTRGEERDRRWVTTTDIHVFGATSATATEYRGSGSVDGNLINQFALSEYEGDLRVATTVDLGTAVVPAATPVPDDAPTSSGGGSAPEPVMSSEAITPVDPGVSAPPLQQPETESAVTVMRMQGDRLRQIGRVGGLGKGERIYAVRFLGPTGYVVTFRQVDPLYTVDLRDPTAPRVVGELKIPGFSSYLHPVDDRTLIGVGQDATEQGRTTGLQVGLFDVSDPGAPKRIQVHTVPGAGSEAEYDHHAFLWWPKTGTVVLPVFSHMVAFDDRGGGQAVPTGPAAIALRVTREGIERTGAIRQGDANDPVRRSLVIGERLLTISDGGVQTSSVDGANALGWLAFP